MAKPLERQLERIWNAVEAGGGGGSAGVASFNARTGAVTLGSGDVTGALGFTPQAAGSYSAADHNHAGVYSLVGHVHPISEVTGLQTALNGKQDAGSYAAASHTHVIADVTGLQTALDGKQASGSYVTSANFTWANLSGKPSTFAPSAHNHSIAEVTGLQTALDGKQASGSYAAATHTHAAGDITSGTLAAARMPGLTGDVTSSAGAVATTLSVVNSNVGTFGNSTTVPVVTVDAKGRVTAVSTAAISGGGGADPWTYLKLANDFTTNSSTAVDVTGLAFTPSANTTYEFEAHLMCRTATATVGPRAGLTWPTGGSDGAASIYTPSSASAETMVHGNIAAAMLAAVGGLPSTTGSYGVKVLGIFAAGASPTGTLKVQLASETAGTNVIAKAGSFLKYRTI